MTSKTSKITDEQIDAAIANLTDMGKAFMRQVGERRFDFFDNGIAEDSGNYSLNMAAQFTEAKTPKSAGGVMSRLLSQPEPLWRVTPGESGHADGSDWWDLTALGAAVALKLAEGETVPAPAHEISNDAAANRKAASKAKSSAARKGAASAATRTSEKTTTKASKPAAEKTSSEPKRDELSEHIVAVFKGKKRGTFMSASEIAKTITDVFPSEDERPSSQTISGRCRDNRMPNGIEGQSGPRGAIKL